mgnify:CR=1 FL=1
MISPTIMNQVGWGNEKKLAIAESVKMQPAIIGNFLFSFLLINFIKKPHNTEPIIQPANTNNQRDKGSFS